MAKLLIVFSSRSGQTRKIAYSLAREIRHLGHRVEVLDIKNISNAFRIEDFDAVLAGAPVYASRYSTSLRRWVKSNVRILNAKPSGFFSVCLGILEVGNLVTQEAERRVITDFFASSGWRPRQFTIFAGAVLYTQYSWLKRRIMKRIVQSAGGATDTSRDYEYTDWEAVRRFARDFTREVEEFLRHPHEIAA